MTELSCLICAALAPDSAVSVVESPPRAAFTALWIDEPVSPFAFSACAILSIPATWFRS